MAKPVVKITGKRQEFYWEDCEIYAILSHIHEHQDGRITAEVNFKTNSEGLPPHVLQTQINLLSSRSKKEVAKQLQERFELPDDKWEDIIEQLCVIGIQNYRTGKPPKEIFPCQDLAEIPESEFLIYPLIYKDKPTIIFGEGGTGKSLLALTLAIMTQLPYEDNALRLKPKKANALYLDYESDELEFRKRLTLLTRGFGLPDTPILYRECELPFVEDIDHLEEIIAEYSIGFVIIDSLGVAVGNTNLNEAATATAFFSALRRLNVTSLILTHTAKDTEAKKATPFGTIFFTNLARSIWHVCKHQEQGTNETAIDLIHTKNNQGPLFGHQGFKFIFKPDEIQVMRIEPETVPEFVEKMSLKKRIELLLKQEGKLSTKELAELLQTSEHSVRTILARYKDTFVRLDKEWALKSKETIT